MSDSKPEVQLISNIVVQREDGKVMLVKYDAEDERWWLPGADLATYQHPDERAKEILEGLTGLKWDSLEMVFIESFRGRRGWHVMFNYRATGSGEVKTSLPSEWFSLDSLPTTMHGKWEIGVIRRATER